MPLSNATQQRNANAQANGQGGEGAAPADGEAPTVSFVRGSRRRTDPFHDETNSVTTATSQVGPEQVVARGFMRHIVLRVDLQNGSGSTTAAVATEDAPFNILSNVRLQDVNGNSIVDLTGYWLMLANKWGAYAGLTDPRQLPAYSAVDAGGNATFVLRIPVEISGRDALGALANQTASQVYRLQYTIASESDVFSTSPAPTVPEVRVRAWLESWSQPDPADVFGNAVAQEPPSHGTLQQWSHQVVDIDSGSQTVRFARRGNLIRTWVLVFEDSAGARSTTGLPDTVELLLDGNHIDNIGLDVLRSRMAEQYRFDGAADAAGGLDTGVLVWTFSDDLDGVAGFGTRSMYLATHQGSDVELRGSFDAAGKLYVITNDVSPAGPGFYARS